MRRFFKLLILFLFVAGCGQEENNSAKLRIFFPEKNSSNRNNFEASRVSEKSAGQWSGQITQESEADCFGIFIGGPEEENQRNFCNDRATDERVVNFGRYIAAISRNGESTEIEIQAETPREITIIAMASANGLCSSFANLSPPAGFYSYPRVVHQQEYVFAPGEQTVDIEINSVFDQSNSELDLCQFDSDEQVEEPGTPLTIADLQFATTGDYDFGGVLSGSSTSAVLTLTNTGDIEATDLSATGLAPPFQFTGGTYPGTSGTCGTTLAGGSSCSIEVQFSPTAVSSFSRTLTIDYNDSENTQSFTRNILGTGVGMATLAISDGPTYSYGTVAVGATPNHVFTLTNSGGTTATAISEVGLAAPYVFTGGSFPGTSGTCGASLTAGASCTLDISYSPTIASASDSDTINISYNDGSSLQTATRVLTGVAVNPASLTISETDPYDYGSLVSGTTTTHTFTVTNVGSFQASSLAEVGLSSPFDFLGGTFPGTGGDCATTLNAAASCNIVVEFAPTVTGLQTDTIDISYNNGVTTQNATRDVQGTGIAPAVLTISDGPGNYDYGSLVTTTNSNHIFTVTNSGAATATGISGAGLAAPFSFTGGTYPGTSGTCTTSLAGAASCTIDVTYAPVVTGPQTDFIDMSYNDGAILQVASRGVQGNGILPAVLSMTEPDPYDFGTQTAPGTYTATVTLNNTGGATATTLSDAGGLAAPFGYAGGAFPGTGGTCTASLAPGASCTLDIEFSPSTMSLFSDTLTLNYNDGAALQVFNFNVQGTGGP